MYRRPIHSSCYRRLASRTFHSSDYPNHPLSRKARSSNSLYSIRSPPDHHQMSISSSTPPTETPPSSAPLLIRFYHSSLHAPSPSTPPLPTLLSWTNTHLETRHDYIQILFPLPEYSPINPSAPPLDQATFSAFRSSPQLRQQLRLAFHRMLAFYGLEVHLDPDPDGNPEDNASLYSIAEGPTFAVRRSFWVMGFNHNHLRLTRIIRSLRVLGCQAEAEALVRGLTHVCLRTGQIGKRSLEFWIRAGRRPLHIAPGDDGDRGQGVGWLKGLADLVGEELERCKVLGGVGGARLVARGGSD